MEDQEVLRLNMADLLNLIAVNTGRWDFGFGQKKYSLCTGFH